MTEDLELIAKLHKDTRQAFMELNEGQVRFIVDLYYSLQEQRKALRNQERALVEAGEPTTVVTHFADQVETLEKQVVPIMDRWTDTQTVGVWSKSVKGIGAILAAGLLAHIDMDKTPAISSLWRYAGLDPTIQWNKGEKRPYNAKLKTLCWKISDSFVKVSGHEDAFYGQLYKQRKAYEVQRNENGELADQAAHILETKDIKSKVQRPYYEAGKLPPLHIENRARRWTVKLFLAHWFEVAYEAHHGTPPPAPYAIAHLDHKDKIEVPRLYDVEV